MLFKEKVRVAKPGANMARVNSLIAQKQDQIEALKLWPLYSKTIKIKSGINQKTDMEVDIMLARIEARYESILGEDFPDVEQEFKEKYLSKVQAMHKSKR